MQINQGVPQDTVLGLFSFNISKNDLDLGNFEFIQYADDTVLYSSHCDLENCKKIT